MRHLYILLAIAISIFACKSDTKQEAAPKSQDPVLSKISALIAKTPDDPSLYIQRANYLYEQESMDAAIKDVQSAIEIDSLQPSYYHLLSDIYLDYYKSKMAIYTLEDAEKLFPNDLKTQLKLSEDNLIVKRYENAVLHANKAVNIDPQSGEAFFMMGMINTELGNTEFALKSYLKAVEYEPEIIDGWLSIAQIYEKQNNPKAIQYFDAALDVEPRNINVLHAKAYYLQNQNNISDAIKIYDQIIGLDRTYEAAYLNAGILNLEIDSLPKAYDMFNILVNVSPANAQGFFYRGVANEQLGKTDLAKADYETALKIQPDHAKAQNALARLQ